MEDQRISSAAAGLLNAKYDNFLIGRWVGEGLEGVNSLLPCWCASRDRTLRGKLASKWYNLSRTPVPEEGEWVEVRGRLCVWETLSLLGNTCKEVRKGVVEPDVWENRQRLSWYSWDATYKNKIKTRCRTEKAGGRIFPAPLPHTFFHFPIASLPPLTAQLASVWWRRTAGGKAVRHRLRQTCWETPQGRAVTAASSCRQLGKDIICSLRRSAQKLT